MKKAILFDLDGTLWDSSQAVVDSWNEVIDTLPDYHKRITIKDMQSWMGRTMDEIASSCFTTVDAKRVAEILNLCATHENEYIEKHGGILYAGLEDTLKKLHEKYFLAIVSNCQKGYIEAFLHYYKLSRYIDDTECFGNTNLPKDGSITVLLERNHIAKEDALYVGDIEGDYLAATKAGLTFVHAAYGFGKVEQAKHRIERISGILNMAETIFAAQE